MSTVNSGQADHQHMHPIGHLTGEAYHEYMHRSKDDHPTRTAFQAALSSLAPHGSSILDFGAGTGIDVKVYAERGYKSYVYDASCEMQNFLAKYCRKEVESGQVRVVDMDYEQLLTEPDLFNRNLDAIVSNFGVFNLISDHGRLFKAFDRWLSPNGFILASLISPYYVGDARYFWWWRNMGALTRTGRYSVGAGKGIVYRYTVRSLSQAARPHFALAGILPSGGKPAPQGSSNQVAPSSAAGFLPLSGHKFMFLLFRRPGGDSVPHL